MRNATLLLGAVLALVGSIGLLLFGDSIARVFLDVFTFRVVNPPAPPPPSLDRLPWAMLSAVTLVLGLVVSCVATVARRGDPSDSALGRSLQVGAGASLLPAAVASAWGVMGPRASFYVIAASPSLPKVEELEQVVRSAGPAMTLGHALAILAAILLTVAALTSFRSSATTSASDGTRPPRGVVLVVAAIGSVMVGALLILLGLTVWSHGVSLETILGQAPTTPEPAELASHIRGILDMSMLLFGGLGALGVLQVLAAVLPPSEISRPDASS